MEDLSRRVKIVFIVNHNKGYLNWLKRYDLRYSQATVKPGYVKYYKQGVVVSTPSISNMIEISDPYIALASLNSRASDVKTDPNPIKRNMRAYVIPFGLQVSYIQDEVARYNAFPVNFDFKQLEVVDATFDIDNAALVVNARLNSEMSLEESNADHTEFYLRQIQPMINSMRNIGVLNEVDIYKDIAAQNSVFNALNTVFSNLGITSIEREDTTRQIRERLINILMKRDYIIFDQETGAPKLLAESRINEPDGAFPEHLDLSLVKRRNLRITRHDVPSFTNTTGLFEYRGAFWPTEDDCRIEISLASTLGQTEDDVVHQRKMRNRMEFLEPLPLDQRIRFLTEADLNNPQLIVYAMTDGERKVYETMSEEFDTSLRKMARDRWNEAMREK